MTILIIESKIAFPFENLTVLLLQEILKNVIHQMFISKRLLELQYFHMC